jgi:general secretion pathway protein D
MTTTDRRGTRAFRLGALSCACAALLSCTTAQRALLPTDMQPMVKEPVVPAPIVQREAAPGPQPGAPELPSGPIATTTIAPTPALPPAPTPRAPAAPAAAPFPPDEKRDIVLNFDQTPLPTFIQVVFGTILKVNFIADQAVAQRQDLVTLRTGQPQNRNEVLQTARLLLRTYGVAVVDLGGGTFRIVPDSAVASFSPEIQRGRALPEVPQPLRPIFYFYELQAVRSADVAQWLRTIYGQRIQFTEDAQRNALLLSGQADNVAAVIESIKLLDQPLLRGRSSVRIEPAYWSAEEMARRLAEIMTAQGYQVGTQAAGPQPTLLLPVGPINSIIAFSSSPEILDLIVRWARDLDQPGSARSGSSGFFTYQVRNTDAKDLATTLQAILASGPATPAAPGQPPRQAPRVVVHPQTNTLIFQGSPESYTQFIGLLQELDRPARSALIEVTVAEVTLGDKESLGIEWQLSDRSINNNTVQIGTLGGLGIGSDGLLVRVLGPGGQVRALINALASKNRARVLSSPRLMARSGEQANIQVGQEVPVITSQQTTATPISPGAILQTIQYRQTGVILRVRPTIHSSGRIDLEVAQEVSAASSTQTGVNNSPTISTRKVDTKLSLADGNTVLLGGLISQNDSRSDTGVPILKDIPGIGQLFRTNNDSTDRTELIVLITPYIINNDFEARTISEAFRSQLGPWASPTGGPAALLPPPLPVPSKTAPKPEVPPSKSKTPPPATTEPQKPAAPEPPAAKPAQSGPNQPVDDPKLIEEIQRALKNSPPAKK